MTLKENIELLSRVQNGIDKIKSSGELYSSNGFERELNEIMSKVEYLAKDIEKFEKDRK